MITLRGYSAAIIASLAACGTAGGGVPGGVELPAFERFALPNGAEVALMEKHDTPLISVTAVVRGGALADPPGKEGTASLFVDLTQKGAGKRDAAQFAGAIESSGGELTADAGAESLSVSASFLAKDADLMLELVGDALMRPRLDSAEFEKVRTRAIQSIAAAKDSDPSTLIGDYGDAWLFRGHPYGRPVGGEEASLQAVALDDVQRYFSEQVNGDRLILAVVGDFNAAGMKRKLEAGFGRWRKGTITVPSARPAQRVEERRVLLVDKPGATQTYFWLGNVGASRTDPARTAQSLVNTVLGGRYTSMLNTELRLKGGLTYGISSNFDRLSQPGAFRITSFTQSEKTNEAIDMTLAILDRLRADGLDASTVASAKAYMLGQFPPTLETNGQLAGRLADMLFHGLGPEDVNEYAARVTSVNDGAVRAAIDGAFPRSTNLAVVLIGDAALIRDRVKKYGPVTEMKMTDPRFAPQ
jgi:predicted Zn-dependent peptidase